MQLAEETMAESLRVYEAPQEDERPVWVPAEAELSSWVEEWLARAGAAGAASD